jgi:hypothetical protein
MGGGNSHQRSVQKALDKKVEKEVSKAVAKHLGTPARPQAIVSVAVKNNRAKFREFLESPVLWGGIGILIGAIASPLTFKYLFILAWLVIVVAVLKENLWESYPKTTKWLASILACAVVMIFAFFMWKVIPKPKEPPSIDETINAFTKKFPFLSNPVPIVNVNPQITLPKTDPHTHVEYHNVVYAAAIVHLPGTPDLHVGRNMTIPFFFRNASDFAVQGPEDAGIVLLVPVRDIDRISSAERKKFKFYPPGGGDMPAHSIEGSYHTWESPQFTEEDIKKINLGKLALCAFGAVRWKDGTGRYETGFDQCFIMVGGSLNWHAGSDNNKERPLY